MKNIGKRLWFVAVGLLISMILTVPAAAEQNKSGTLIGIEQYGPDTDYTGWLELKLKVLSPEGEPEKGIYVVVRKADVQDGETAGQGPGINGDTKFLTDENGEIIFRVYPSPITYEAYVPKQGEWMKKTYGPYRITANDTISIMLERNQGGSGGSSSGSGSGPGVGHGDSDSSNGPGVIIVESTAAAEPEETTAAQKPEETASAQETMNGESQKENPAADSGLHASTGDSDTESGTLPEKEQGTEGGTSTEESLENQKEPEGKPGASDSVTTDNCYIHVVVWLVALMITLLFLIRIRMIRVRLRHLKEDEGQDE